MTRQCHPLATVVDACAPLRFAPLPDLRLRSFTRSGDQGDAGQWCRADLLAAKNAFAPVYDGFVAATRPGHRLPAATHFLRAVFREPIFLVAAGLYLTGRAPLLDASHLWFPIRADRTLGTPMLTGLKVAVTADDRFAGHPETVTFPGSDDVVRAAAHAMVAAFTPVIDALSAHTRVGKRTLWGWVLDTAHFYMLNPARFLGRDAQAAWALANRLADALLEAGAVTRARPRLFPFCDNHPRGTWAVRGTCCFDYKGDPEHGYCTTCPHKCDNERRNELQEWLRNPALAP